MYKYLIKRMGIVTIALLILVMGCEKMPTSSYQSLEEVAKSDIKNISANEPTCIDIDGNVYKVVKIGEQWWMAENLRVKHYRNMDPIQEIVDQTQWRYLNNAAYCYCDNNINTEDEYGLLYNWKAVTEDRGIAPIGWHIPTDSELQALVNHLGGETVAGGKMKERDNTHWYYPNNASNSSGFTALPGGYRASNGEYHGFRGFGFLWSATPSINSGSWYQYMDHLYDHIVRSNCDKRFGFSVRCVLNTDIHSVRRID